MTLALPLLNKQQVRGAAIRNRGFQGVLPSPQRPIIHLGGLLAPGGGGGVDGAGGGGGAVTCEGSGDNAWTNDMRWDKGEGVLGGGGL